ncbi:MAG: hypothetical protein JNK76_15240 [Planctomycetales bacterium]|nr:hypothetical protein [Planctomycetales bacterium]MBN8625653.1 hypothetical protein [Planctomycetota bacterium]
MIARIVVLAAVVFAGVVGEASAAYTPAQRATIRSMPITQRPYRPGHVYGNTVRALNRIGRN